MDGQVILGNTRSAGARIAKGTASSTATDRWIGIGAGLGSPTFILLDHALSTRDRRVSFQRQINDAIEFVCRHWVFRLRERWRHHSTCRHHNHQYDIIPKPSLHVLPPSES